MHSFFTFERNFFVFRTHSFVLLCVKLWSWRKEERENMNANASTAPMRRPILISRSFSCQRCHSPHCCWSHVVNVSWVSEKISNRYVRIDSFHQIFQKFTHLNELTTLLYADETETAKNIGKPTDSWVMNVKNTFNF